MISMTRQQQGDFNRCCDFLARMIEKYGDSIELGTAQKVALIYQRCFFKQLIYEKLCFVKRVAILFGCFYRWKVSTLTGIIGNQPHAYSIVKYR